MNFGLPVLLDLRKAVLSPVEARACKKKVQHDVKNTDLGYFGYIMLKYTEAAHLLPSLQ